MVSFFFKTFTPILGEMIPNLTYAHFSNGLVQPPTRESCSQICGRELYFFFPEVILFDGRIESNPVGMG